MSIVQYPPVLPQPWLAGERVHYFVRGQPQLRPKEAALQWNGERKVDAGWKGKRAWGPNMREPRPPAISRWPRLRPFDFFVLPNGAPAWPSYPLPTCTHLEGAAILWHPYALSQ